MSQHEERGGGGGESLLMAHAPFDAPDEMDRAWAGYAVALQPLLALPEAAQVDAKLHERVSGSGRAYAEVSLGLVYGILTSPPHAPAFLKHLVMLSRDGCAHTPSGFIPSLWLTQRWWGGSHYARPAWLPPELTRWFTRQAGQTKRISGFAWYRKAPVGLLGVFWDMLQRRRFPWAPSPGKDVQLSAASTLSLAHTCAQVRHVHQGAAKAPQRQLPEAARRRARAAAVAHARAHRAGRARRRGTVPQPAPPGAAPPLAHPVAPAWRWRLS